MSAYATCAVCGKKTYADTIHTCTPRETWADPVLLIADLQRQLAEANAEVQRLTLALNGYGKHPEECAGTDGEGACVSHMAYEESSQQLEVARKALEAIASFSEGPIVNGSFDEPGSAEIARQALAAIGQGGGNG